MRYSLERQGRVIVVYQGVAMEFDAIASFTVEAQLREYRANRRTLHKKSNYSEAVVTGMEPVTLSLTTNFTDNNLEKVFFLLMGMQEVEHNLLILPETSAVEPIYIEVYISYPNNENYRITRAFVSVADFIMDRSVPLLHVGIEAGLIEQVRDVPLVYSKTQGQVRPVLPTFARINYQSMVGVTGATMSFQQQCSWREQRSVFDIGKISHNSRAYIQETNYSATLNTYKRGVKAGYSSEFYDDFKPITNARVELSNGATEIVIPSAHIVKRLTTGEVNQIALDIMPTFSGSPVSIQFREENKT